MTDPAPSSNAQAQLDRAARDRAERALLERARTGDEQAFESLFDAYVEPLCAFAYTYVQSQDVAQEVVQDLFCRLWERRHSLELPRSVHAYLYSATRNRAINYLRDRRVESAFLERAQVDGERAGTSVPRPDEEAQAGELAAALEKAVAEMPLRCREVFTLVRDQHLTYAEAGTVLGISPKTVEIHMGRALAILRERLHRWIEP